MKELLRTNNVVTLSFIESLLSDAGIVSLILDEHMSILEGSVGVLPRRLLVRDEDHFRATRLIKDAGLSHELRQ